MSRRFTRPPRRDEFRKRSNSQNKRERCQQIRLFEYDSLQNRIALDSRASYTLMTALVALSEGILAATLTNLDRLPPVARIGAAVASLSALLFWYPFDRRFVWSEKRRLTRITLIERGLGLYNERIFIDEYLHYPELEAMIQDVDRDAGLFALFSVHHLYLVLILSSIIAWLFIILS